MAVQNWRNLRQETYGRKAYVLCERIVFEETGGCWEVAGVYNVAEEKLAVDRINAYLERHGLTTEDLVDIVTEPPGNRQHGILRCQIGRIVERLSRAYWEETDGNQVR